MTCIYCNDDPEVSVNCYCRQPTPTPEEAALIKQVVDKTVGDLAEKLGLTVGQLVDAPGVLSGSLSAKAFANAGRFHSGGYVSSGLHPNGIPAVLTSEHQIPISTVARMVARRLGATEADMPGLWNLAGYPELTSAQLVQVGQEKLGASTLIGLPRDR